MLNILNDKITCFKIQHINKLTTCETIVSKLISQTISFVLGVQISQRVSHLWPKLGIQIVGVLYLICIVSKDLFKKSFLFFKILWLLYEKYLMTWIWTYRSSLPVFRPFKSSLPVLKSLSKVQKSWCDKCLQFCHWQPLTHTHILSWFVFWFLNLLSHSSKNPILSSPFIHA